MEWDRLFDTRLKCLKGHKPAGHLWSSSRQSHVSQNEKINFLKEAYGITPPPPFFFLMKRDNGLMKYLYFLNCAFTV